MTLRVDTERLRRILAASLPLGVRAALNLEIDAGDTFGHQAGAIPLCGDPGRIVKGWLVGGDEDAGPVERLDHLLPQRCLTHLPRTGHNVEKSPRLAQAVGERGRIITLKSRACRFAHYSE